MDEAGLVHSISLKTAKQCVIRVAYWRFVCLIELFYTIMEGIMPRGRLENVFMLI